MANMTGAASQSLFTQQEDSRGIQDNAIGDLTALVQVLLGQVESLTQKVDAFGTNNMPGMNIEARRHSDERGVGLTGRNTSEAHPDNTAEGRSANNNTDSAPTCDVNRQGGTGQLMPPRCPSNASQVQNDIIPTMSTFLNNNNFFSGQSSSSVPSNDLNEGVRNVLSRNINEFDIKLYKCRKLQLEVSYLEECIHNKIIPKGLRQWRYPAGLTSTSSFYSELIALFDRQGHEFLQALINFYTKDITVLKTELEVLEHGIKSDKDFPRYKYEYCRIYTSIEATMNKLLVTKKKKIARDINDYANNQAYPKPPSSVQTSTNDNCNNQQGNDFVDNPNPLHINGNFSNEQGQPLRRSPRFTNNNNNSNNGGDSNLSNDRQNHFSDNNQGVDVQNQQGFRPVTNGRRNKRQSTYQQNTSRNRRRTRRR
ncbi:probable basic-leucine zipper transcription factor E [Protopterus annectens]|uniref:probable basic-leucine zipper transcription factor E n=1 Tax=Protopterus annectens TaxID=7888 RepID=UPI001CF96838|nr:probable basic-leucine zipper transcription factor E [Protopterus annectens]